jgi:hypothetical protein
MLERGTLQVGRHLSSFTVLGSEGMQPETISATLRAPNRILPTRLLV